jgi:hypothetical protein
VTSGRLRPLLLLLALACAAPALADYLEVRRKAPLRAAPDTSAAVVRGAVPGETLALLEDGEQSGGYYHVRVAGSAGGAWLYRTAVRRFRGDPPGAAADAATGEDGFLPGCELPFGDIAGSELAIDATCPIEGVGSSEAHLAQNRSKNNFCAPGPVVSLKLGDFERLQDFADQSGIPHGSSNALPANRGVLQNVVMVNGRAVGEGSLVRFVGFIQDAHYSNLSKGESVNCKVKGKAHNDIHVSLVENSAETEECASVTAEISPHFRPSAWEPENLTDLGRPVRLSGHLFFDGSHVPCRGSKRASPPRISVWEIHPVYAIDVCAKGSLGACKVTDESLWTPLHVWAGLEENEN